MLLAQRRLNEWPENGSWVRDHLCQSGRRLKWLRCASYGIYRPSYAEAKKSHLQYQSVQKIEERKSAFGEAVFASKIQSGRRHYEISSSQADRRPQDEYRKNRKTLPLSRALRSDHLEVGPKIGLQPFAFEDAGCRSQLPGCRSKRRFRRCSIQRYWSVVPQDRDF